MKNVRCLGSKLDNAFNDFEIQIPTSPPPPSFQKKWCNSRMRKVLLYNMVIFYMRKSVANTLALSKWAYRAPSRSRTSVKKFSHEIPAPLTEVCPPYSPKVGATYKSFVQNGEISWYNVYMKYEVHVMSKTEATHRYSRCSDSLLRTPLIPQNGWLVGWLV